MNPLYLFPLALIVPFVVAIVAFTPAYTALFSAVYIIYDRPDAVNPLLAYKFDIFYILDVYGQLFSYWTEHTGSSNFIEFTLPLIGLPAFGIGLSIFLTWKLIAALVNFFRMMTAS